MTPKKIAALQWIFDVRHLGLDPASLSGFPPTNRMFDILAREWLLGTDGRLTHLGLRALNELTR